MILRVAREDLTPKAVEAVLSIVKTVSCWAVASELRPKNCYILRDPRR